MGLDCLREFSLSNFGYVTVHVTVRATKCHVPQGVAEMMMMMIVRPKVEKCPTGVLSGGHHHNDNFIIIIII